MAKTKRPREALRLPSGIESTLFSLSPYNRQLMNCHHNKSN